MITAYSLDGGKHVLMENNRDEGAFVYMKEAARATSAAPTYFPPFQIPLPDLPESKSAGLEVVSFIDGGVFANNPAPYAIAIAREQRAYSGSERLPYDDDHPMLIASLGTGRVTSTPDPEAAWRRGSLNWIGPLIDILLSDPGIEDEVRQLVGGLDHYIRLQPPNLSKKNARLDNVTRDNLKDLEGSADAYVGGTGKDDFERLVYLLERERPPECRRVRNKVELRARPTP